MVVLAQIIDAHGGLTRWPQRHKVEAIIESGRGFFPLKRNLEGLSPKHVRLNVFLNASENDICRCVRSRPKPNVQFEACQVSQSKIISDPCLPVPWPCPLPGLGPAAGLSSRSGRPHFF